MLPVSPLNFHQNNVENIALQSTHFAVSALSCQPSPKSSDLQSLYSLTDYSVPMGFQRPHCFRRQHLKVDILLQ